MLAEKKLLTGAFDVLAIDSLGQCDDVIKRALLDPAHFNFKLLDGLVERGLLLAKLNEFGDMQAFDDRLGSETQVDLELEFLGTVLVLEDTLVVNDTTSEKSLQHDVASVNHQVYFGDSVLQDVDLIDRVINLLVGTLLDLRSLHLVDHIVENSVCVLEMSEKR